MGRPFVPAKVTVIPPTVKQILRKAADDTIKPKSTNKLERALGSGLRRLAGEEERENC